MTYSYRNLDTTNLDMPGKGLCRFRGKDNIAIMKAIQVLKIQIAGNSLYITNLNDVFAKFPLHIFA